MPLLHMFKATFFRQPGDEVGFHRVFNGRPNPRDWAKWAHSHMECGTSRGCSQLGENIAVFWVEKRAGKLELK